MKSCLEQPNILPRGRSFASVQSRHFDIHVGRIFITVKSQLLNICRKQLRSNTKAGLIGALERKVLRLVPWIFIPSWVVCYFSVRKRTER